MANVISNTTVAGGLFAKGAAKLFEDNLQFCKSIEKADSNDFNGKNGYSAGDTVLINIPNRSKPTSSFDQTSTVQDMNETTVPLKLDIISSSAFAIDTLEYATKLQQKRTFERIIKPAIVDMAHDFENKVLQQATQAVYNSVGTAGAGVFDTDAILSAREKLGKFLAPKDMNRSLLLDSTASRNAVNARKGQFQSSSEIDKQYKYGYIGKSDGFTWLESELIQSHTNGNDVTSVLVNDAAAATAASTLKIDGLTATTGTVKKGQVFTIATVFGVHPVTKKKYTFLQQFVITADATADGSGAATVSVSPTMYSTGALQNIDALPADNAAITFVGAASTAYGQNLAYHSSAFRLATVPLIMPKNAELAAQHNYKGVNVSIIYDWDQLARKMVLRLDILGALAVPRPEWACRLTD